jgi:hypothetical protein
VSSLACRTGSVGSDELAFSTKASSSSRSHAGKEAY